MAEYKIFKKDENDFFNTLTNRDFDLIHKLVNSILKAIKNKKKTVDAFEVMFPDGSSLLFTMKYENFKECLQNCIDDFAKQERYEDCVKIKETINML